MFAILIHVLVLKYLSKNNWTVSKLCTISLGMNSLMFVNCSVFCDVQHVWSSVFGQNVMFGSVRSLVLLLCDQTSLGTYSLMFANCSGFCDVRHVRSSILGQNVMFGKFDVQTFNVRSVRSSVFWCSFQDYLLSKQINNVSARCFWVQFWPF